MIIVLDVERAEQDLTAGRLTCPSCTGTLRLWSWAPQRLVRQRDGSARPVRPRRADATEVVGAALAAKAAGRGVPAHRRRAGPPAVHGAPLAAPGPQRRAHRMGCAPTAWHASTSSTPRSCPPAYLRSPLASATRCRPSPRRCTPTAAGPTGTPTGGRSSARSLLDDSSQRAHQVDQLGPVAGGPCPRSNVTMTTKAHHHEHGGVTATTKPRPDPYSSSVTPSSSF